LRIFFCLVKDEALDAADEAPPGNVFVDFVLKSQKFLKSQCFSAKSALQQLYIAKQSKALTCVSVCELREHVCEGTDLREYV